MAGKSSSAKFLFLVAGYDMLGAKLKEIRYKVLAPTIDSDGIGDGWKEFCSLGTREAEVTQDGAFFNTAAGNIHEAVSGNQPTTPQAVPRIVCIGPEGNLIGSPFVGVDGGYFAEYEVLTALGDLQRANVAYKITGELEDGVILHEHSAETGDDDTEDESVDHTAEPQVVTPITSNSQANPTVVTCPIPHKLTTGDTVLIAGEVGSSPTINGERTVTVISPTTFSVPVNTSGGSGGTGGSFVRGKTNGGGSAFLQVSALTLGGYDDATVTIRDSDDDVTFADLVSFAATTAARTAQRVTVAGAVERYLASAVEFGGSGSGPSITFFCGFCRG